MENKGEANHFLEILENLEISEILEIPPVKRPLSQWPLFPVPINLWQLNKSRLKLRSRPANRCNVLGCLVQVNRSVSRYSALLVVFLSNLRSLLNQGLVHTRVRRKKAPFSRTFSFFSAVLRVRGRFQNPSQTLVCTKLRLKRFPKVSRWLCDPDDLVQNLNPVPNPEKCWQECWQGSGFF